MRAAIYLRVSTDDQAEKYGLDVQRRRCEAMAAVKGWHVSQTFVDDGISGTLDENGRPGLASLLLASAAGDIDAVITLALDRLARKAVLILNLVDMLASNGTELVSCKESIDTTTAVGKFLITVFAGLAQLERDNIVERTTAGRNERGRIDGEKGGRVPMGYIRTFDAAGTANGVRIIEAEAKIVRLIFEMRQQGDSLRNIADWLNFDGVKTRRGKQWHASSVKAILDNEAIYRGGYRGQSPETWPAIL